MFCVTAVRRLSADGSEARESVVAKTLLPMGFIGWHLVGISQQSLRKETLTMQESLAVGFADTVQKYVTTLRNVMTEVAAATTSIGIFAWAALEPEEGRFEFGWLDRIFDRFESEGLSINLAMPSGSRPRWLAGFFGDLDTHPTPKEVDDLDAVLTKFGKPHDFHRYPGVNHAFMNKEGKNYHPKAAKETMELGIAFLRKHTAPR